MSLISWLSTKIFAIVDISNYRRYTILSSIGTTLVQRFLHPQYHDWGALARSKNGCPLLRVCVHGVCVCSLLCVCALWMG